MKTSRWGTIVLIVCVAALFAATAHAVSRRDPGMSGIWQEWGDGLWQYFYWQPTDCEFWRYKSNGEQRFAYKPGPGQWWNYSSRQGGMWAPIGLGGVGNTFLGDGVTTAVDSDWKFYFNEGADTGFWIESSANETRFAYKYNAGQWWDYTNQWGHLGIGELATMDFIGDGNSHTFDTSLMSGGSYIGYTADASFQYTGDAYIWSVGGSDRYKYEYGSGYTGTWYWGDGLGSWYSMQYGGTWENPDCRYHGGGLFIESGLAWDPGSDRPPDADILNPKRLEYNVWDVSTGWDFTFGWFIGVPGSDNAWSGGDLNMLWCLNDGSDEPWSGHTEWTNDDVVCFVEDLTSIGFSSMVDRMKVARDFYRKNISNVTVVAHGNSSGWQMGEWMSIYNYTLFQSDWERWGTLCTADAQIVSTHCETGNATDMLNQVAAWTGCDIYANTNTTWTYSNRVVPGEPRGGTTYWNYNVAHIWWTDEYDGDYYGADRYFEYTTTGSQDWDWILYY